VAGWTRKIMKAPTIIIILGDGSSFTYLLLYWLVLDDESDG